MVSNHGGRQVDRSAAALVCLPLRGGRGTSAPIRPLRRAIPRATMHLSSRYWTWEVS
ncbi:MAG: hypothetical protein ACRDRM_05870 [Pseudonocardiaceae bacterium]